jgi:hypothetical protein
MLRHVWGVAVTGQILCKNGDQKTGSNEMQMQGLLNAFLSFRLK